MHHVTRFTRSRLVVGAVALSALSVVAAGCGGGSAAAPFNGNPTFQQQMQPDSTAAAQVAQQNLVSDLAQLKKDATTLTRDTTVPGDLTTLSAALTTEDQDWQQMQHDSCSSMASDGQLVAFDAQTVSRDATSLQGDVGGMQTGDIAAVSNDLANIQNDLSALKTLGTTPQVTTAPQVTAGTKAVQGAHDMINSVTKSQNGLSVKGTQYLAGARRWSKQHTC
jgi:hypothetical protein